MNDIIPSKDEFLIIKEICNNAIASQLLPKSLSIQGAVLVALKGRELGIPPIMALSEISVINGKAAMSAVLMLSLVQKAYPHLKIKFNQTDEKCIVSVLQDKETGWQDFSFSMDDADRAGLLYVAPGKQPGPWHKYPRAMMRSRAVSEMCRSLFPAALMGSVYTPEELNKEPLDVDVEIVKEEKKEAFKKSFGDAIKSITPKVAPVSPVPDLTQESSSTTAEQVLFNELPSTVQPIKPKTSSDIKELTRVSEPQLKRLFAISNQRGVSYEVVHDLIKKKWNYSSAKELFVNQYDELVNHIQTKYQVKDSSGQVMQ